MGLGIWRGVNRQRMEGVDIFSNLLSDFNNVYAQMSTIGSVWHVETVRLIANLCQSPTSKYDN